MIVLSEPPIWADVADSNWAVDQPLYASKIAQLVANAKFAMCRREVFIVTATDGQTIPPPKSSLDGYQYSYAEVTFWWTRRTTYNAALNKQTGNGCLFQWMDSVSVAGAVSVSTEYYIDGGAETFTNDGQLIVYLFCQRAMPALGAVATWSDVPDQNFAGGQAAATASLLQMNKNIRYAALRKEFFVSQHRSGETVTLPVSPVDGYTYKRNELLYLPSMMDTRNAAGSRSGGGTLRQIVVTVNPDTGSVSCAETYYVNGGALTNTTDGLALVLTIGVRDR